MPALKPTPKVIGLEQTLPQLCSIWSEQLASCNDKLASEISAISNSFAELVENLGQLKTSLADEQADQQPQENAPPLASQFEQLENEIYRILAALQFQDRVSQILTHVESNMRTIHAQLEESEVSKLTKEETIDARAWLDTMATHFTTAEERHNFRQHQGIEEQPDEQADDSEITFF